MAKTNRKAKTERLARVDPPVREAPTTLEEAGIPVPVAVAVSRIPIHGADGRLAFVDWESIHVAVGSDKAVALRVDPLEVDAAIRMYYREALCSECPALIDWVYIDGTLWMWGYGAGRTECMEDISRLE